MRACVRACVRVRVRVRVCVSVCLARFRAVGTSGNTVCTSVPPTAATITALRPRHIRAFACAFAFAFAFAYLGHSVPLVVPSALCVRGSHVAAAAAAATVKAAVRLLPLVFLWYCDDSHVHDPGKANHVAFLASSAHVLNTRRRSVEDVV